MGSTFPPSPLSLLLLADHRLPSFILILQITSQAYGHTFPSTINAEEASLIVLDPSCDAANYFLRIRSPEKVVSLLWLKESFLKDAPLLLDDYRLARVEEKREEVEGGKVGGEVHEDEEEEVASSS